jgi:prophage regulatory protein
VIDEYVSAEDLEIITKVPAATWRYWGWVGEGPISIKVGRRRVWRRSVVEAWLRELEDAATQTRKAATVRLEDAATQSRKGALPLRDQVLQD